ncbi:MAG: phage shock protein operon transcriptional activator [Sphingomonadales bacterium]|nr:phage shock protein operon transcriptional activator [Sphingomonadales bacterium]
MSAIGGSHVFLDLLDQVSKIAVLDRPVLVVGERGTGKELVASRLHFLSRRWDRAFVKMNCASLAESLIESELFGYEAGAFTGATRQRAGRFEVADNGTLFLDEVASLSASAQEKLLRVVEYGEFDRVGGNQTISVDVRVVAAANVDLPELADMGGFRHDLLDRLAFDVLTVPPLRARHGDIMLLANHFATRMASELEYVSSPIFSKNAEAALQDHGWPGNVRELKNVVERAVYRWPDEGPVEDIIFDPFDSPWRPDAGAALGVSKKEAGFGSQPVSQDKYKLMPDARQPLDLKKSLQTVEKELVEVALSFNKFNQRDTAKHLSMSYDQLRHILKKHGL